jgi:predicted RNA binding protein YcfA (HicA-like mRNA interferase family)
MTPRDRRLKRILADPPEADFEDVRRVLEDHGWVLDRERGSHSTFVKEGEYPFVVPKSGGRKVKRMYLRKMIELLDLA